MENWLKWWRIRDAYRELFHRNTRELGKIYPALTDLREFCAPDTVPLRVGKDGHTDLYQTGIVAGRQEVWHRVCQTLALTDEQLERLKEIENG